MMTKKNIIIVSSAVAGIAVISVGLAISLRGEKGPDFAGKKPEEIKAYFESHMYRSLNKKDQIAIKKKAYALMYQQRERAFIEQAKTYSQLPPQQKVRYLDRMIDQIVRDTEQKQRSASTRTQGPQIKNASFQRGQTKGGNVNAGRSSSAKKTFTSQDYRSWTEKMDPEKRAYVLELKEALSQRMEQRGIEIW